MLLLSQVINETVQQQEPLFEQLIRAGRNILETSEPGPDRDALESKLSDTTQRWDSVKRQTAERQEQLNQVLPLAKEFHSEMQDIKPWLSAAEKRLQGVEPDVCDHKSIEKQLETLGELKKEIDERRPVVDAAKDTSSSLTDSCSADKYVIEGEEQDVRKRFDNLSCDVSRLEDNLASLKEVLEHYDKALAPVEKLLESAEKSLASGEPTGIDVEKGKAQLKTIEDLLSSLRAREPDVNDLMDAGDKLASALDPKSAEVPRVKKEVEDVSNRYHDLLESLSNEKEKLEKETEKALKFQDALRNLEEWLPRVEEALAAQDPISSDPEVVKQQLQQAEVNSVSHFSQLDVRFLSDPMFNRKCKVEKLEEERDFCRLKLAVPEANIPVVLFEGIAA